MNLILTMAGRYSRFIDEGYRIPKYLLPWGARSILGEIIFELSKNNNLNNVYLVANKRDEIYMPHVRKTLASLGISTQNLFLISDTDGQAETAYLSIQNIQKKFGEMEGSIIFHNIDTILHNRDLSDLENILKQYDGYIDIFKSSNHNYSYVLVVNNEVQSIAEKVLISNNATSGFYAFSSAQKFLEFYSNKELYISDLYQKMLDNGVKIMVSAAHSEKDTIVLGTPSEYLTSAYILDL
jgi:NDP-sugar pyrophosphorylase family protein